MIVFSPPTALLALFTFVSLVNILAADVPVLAPDTGSMMPPGDAQPGNRDLWETGGEFKLQSGVPERCLVTDWRWTPISLTEYQLFITTEAGGKTTRRRLSDFAPAEHPRLLSILWYDFHRNERWQKRITAALADEKNLMGRIAAYTGTEGRIPGEINLPDMHEPSLAGAEDLRKPQEWFRFDAAKGRYVSLGKVRLVDWAMAEGPKPEEGDVMVKVEVGGKPVTVPARSIADKDGNRRFAELLWNDWRQLVARKRPGADSERKIHALIMLLRQYLDNRRHDSEAGQRWESEKDGTDAAVIAAGRSSFLESNPVFPPIPPSGMEAGPAKDADRSQLAAGWFVRGKPSLESHLASFAVWWHREGILPLPGRKPGDKVSEADVFEAYQKALTARLSGGRDQSWFVQLGARLDAFASTRLEGKTAFQLRYASPMDSMSRISCYVRGGYATVLKCSLMNGSVRAGEHYLPVISAEDDGTMTVLSGGLALTGVWQEAETPDLKLGPQSERQLIWEFDISAMPESEKKKLGRARFTLDPRELDGMLTVIPLRKP